MPAVYPETPNRKENHRKYSRGHEKNLVHKSRSIVPDFIWNDGIYERGARRVAGSPFFAKRGLRRIEGMRAGYGSGSDLREERQ